MAFRGGMTTQFRSILYSFSAGKFASGDLLSLGIEPKVLRSLRNDFLKVSKHLGDLQSVANRSIGIRVQRRVGGRILGRVGSTIIPQGFGPLTRLANRAYGRQSSRMLNRYFDKKETGKLKFNGNKLTKEVRKTIEQNDRGAVKAQYIKSKRDLGGLGINLKDFNPAMILKEIQLYMIAKVTTAAPKKTGNLRRSIINRGFSARNSRYLATGRLTIGSSMGNPGTVADMAPYWWKTLYPAYYLNQAGRKYLRQPTNPDWFGRSVYKGLQRTLGNDAVQGLSYTDLQPKHPGQESFELSERNFKDLGEIDLP